MSAIPQDYQALQAFAADLQLKYAELEIGNKVLQSEVHHKTLHIEKLKAQLAKFRREKFGRSSEKLERVIEQIEMTLGDLEETVAEKRAEIESEGEPQTQSPEAKQKKSASAPRRSFPAHLPRERVEHEATCVCPACGSKRLTQIGIEEREVIEYVPSHFKVVIYSSPKMGCRDCEKITQAPMPSMPILRGMAGPALLAHVMVSRFDDHLPYYRQSEIFAREGVDLDRSMLADWMGHMSFLLAPLTEAIGKHVRAGETIHADETPLPVLEPGRGRTKTGYLWVALRDERPFASTSPPAVFYHYGPNRKTEQAKILLQGYKGYLHADAYSGYKKLYDPDPVTQTPLLFEVACWAHVRRRLYNQDKANPSPALKDLLEDIAALFAVEAEVQGRPPEERLKERTTRSVPRLTIIRSKCDALLCKISGKTELAEDLRYLLSRWTSFTRYTTDGRLEISNNAAERAMRPVAIGRKNWMFAGSDEGGVRAARAFTLIETAKLNGLNPEAYLNNIIARIADHPINRIDELLPWNVKL